MSLYFRVYPKRLFM